MKEEDITMINKYKYQNKYCLVGLFCRMTGFTKGAGYATDMVTKLGVYEESMLTTFHQQYIKGYISFEEMRQKAIEFMESLKSEVQK